MQKLDEEHGNRASSTTKMNVDYVRSYTFIPSPVMSATNLGAGKVAVSFHGIAGRSYVLEQSTNLVSWMNVATNTAPPDGLIVHTNTATGGRRVLSTPLQLGMRYGINFVRLARLFRST